MRSIGRRRRRGGFTLIELLVAMTVMLVLAGLLLPGLHTGREFAQRSRCASNLRHILIALKSYEADGKGLTMPITNQWATPARYFFGAYNGPSNPIDFDNGLLSAGTALDPEVWQCPSFGPGDFSARVVGRSTGYAYNDTYLSPTAATDPWLPQPVSTSSIRRPTRMVAFGDSARDWNGPLEENWFWTPPSQGVSFNSQYTHFRHALKANAGFYDGHVETLGPRPGTLNANKIGMLAPADTAAPLDWYFDGR